MKFSSKVQKCQLSPVRQFNPCAAEAEAKGRTIYHLKYRPAGHQNTGRVL